MYTKNVADQPGTGRHSVTKWGGYEASKEAPFFGNSPRRRAEPPGAKSVLCDLGPRSPKAPVIRDCSRVTRTITLEKSNLLPKNLEPVWRQDSQPGICWGQITTYLEGSPLKLVSACPSFCFSAASGSCELPQGPSYRLSLSVKLMRGVDCDQTLKSSESTRAAATASLSESSDTIKNLNPWARAKGL